MPRPDNPEKETDGTQIPVPRFIRPGLDRYTFNTHYEKHDNLSEDHAKLQDLHELLEKRLAILGTMKGSGTQSLRQDFKKVMLRLGGWIAELEELAWQSNRCLIPEQMCKVPPYAFFPAVWNDPKPRESVSSQMEQAKQCTCFEMFKYEYRPSRRTEFILQDPVRTAITPSCTATCQSIEW